MPTLNPLNFPNLDCPMICHVLIPTPIIKKLSQTLSQPFSQPFSFCAPLHVSPLA